MNRWLPALSMCLACGAVSSPVADSGAPADAPTTDAMPTLGEQRIVFVSNGSGSDSVWTVNLDGSAPVQVTKTADADDFASVPGDGRRIAFVRDQDIWAIDEDGGSLTRLTTNPKLDTRPAFSYDGSTIVFVSERNGATNIYVMNADGSRQRRLLVTSDWLDFPQFSPDGRRVTFTNVISQEIYVIDVDGNNLTKLTNDPPNTPANNLTSAYSPDGTRIVFSSQRADIWKLYWIAADGSGTAQPIETAGVVEPFHASFDRNGTHVVYHGRKSSDPATRFTLYTTELSSGTTRAISSPASSNRKAGSWAF